MTRRQVAILLAAAFVFASAVAEDIVRAKSRTMNTALTRRSRAQDGLQAVDVGRFQLITEDGHWLLDTLTGNTWQWDCPPGQARSGQIVQLCNVDYEWIQK